MASFAETAPEILTDIEAARSFIRSLDRASDLMEAASAAAVLVMLVLDAHLDRVGKDSRAKALLETAHWLHARLAQLLEVWKTVEVTATGRGCPAPSRWLRGMCIRAHAGLRADEWVWMAEGRLGVVSTAVRLGERRDRLWLLEARDSSRVPLRRGGAAVARASASPVPARAPALVRRRPCASLCPSP